MRRVVPTLLFALFAASFVFAASNQTLSFQGKLLDNTGAAVTGTKAMTFTLYPQATGGTAVTNAMWSQSVNVQNGIYSVELDASAVDLSNVNDAWIEVAVAGETLSPRIHLASSVFSQRAGTANYTTTANYAVIASKLLGGDTAWHYIGDTGEPAFNNGYTNYNNGSTRAGFRKDALGYVHLCGFVVGGVVNATAFQLPVGYRPSQYIYAPGAKYDSPNLHTGLYYSGGLVYITPEGYVQPYESHGYHGLDGISFYAGN